MPPTIIPLPEELARRKASMPLLNELPQAGHSETKPEITPRLIPIKPEDRNIPAAIRTAKEVEEAAAREAKRRTKDLEARRNHELADQSFMRIASAGIEDK